jgi:hypothetical protein
MIVEEEDPDVVDESKQLKKLDSCCILGLFLFLNVAPIILEIFQGIFLKKNTNITLIGTIICQNQAESTEPPRVSFFVQPRAWIGDQTLKTWS